MNLDELLSLGTKFYIHKYTTMPLYLRAGLVSLEKFGVKYASNKEFYYICEAGFTHPIICFDHEVLN